MELRTLMARLLGKNATNGINVLAIRNSLAGMLTIIPHLERGGGGQKELLVVGGW